MEPNRHIPRDPAFLLITQGSFKAELLSGAVRSVRSSCGAVSTKGRRWSCPCPALRHASDARHPILPSAVPAGPRATRGHRRAPGGAIAAGRRIRAPPGRAPSPDPSTRSLGQGPRPGTVSSGSARPLPACFAQSPGRLPAERRAAGGGARRGAKRGCRVARAGGGFGGGGVGSGPGLRPARRLRQAARSGRCHPAAACSTVAAR